jgi:hypothetical protein
VKLHAAVLGILSCLATAGCPSMGHEVGRTAFTGSETQEIVVNSPSPGTVHFDTTLELDVPSSESTINEEWSYTIEVVRNGKTVRSKTCDAFGVGPSLMSGQTGKRLRITRSRILGCSVELDAGTATLRMKLAPTRGASAVTPVHVDLIVMR